jgi:hypothetical protein
MPPYSAIKDDWSDDYDDGSDLAAPDYSWDGRPDEHRPDHDVEDKVREPIDESLEQGSSDESIDSTGQKDGDQGVFFGTSRSQILILSGSVMPRKKGDSLCSRKKEYIENSEKNMKNCTSFCAKKKSEKSENEKSENEKSENEKSENKKSEIFGTRDNLPSMKMIGRNTVCRASLRTDCLRKQRNGSS